VANFDCGACAYCCSRKVGALVRGGGAQAGAALDLVHQIAVNHGRVLDGPTVDQTAHSVRLVVVHLTESRGQILQKQRLRGWFVRPVLLVRIVTRHRGWLTRRHAAALLLHLVELHLLDESQLGRIFVLGVACHFVRRHHLLLLQLLLLLVHLATGAGAEVGHHLVVGICLQ
jgi:hypothetical protein